MLLSPRISIIFKHVILRRAEITSNPKNDEKSDIR